MEQLLYSRPISSSCKDGYHINTKHDYHKMMVDIYELTNKGDQSLPSAEVKRLAAMVSAAEKYEDEVLDLVPRKVPQSIPEAVEMKMEQNNINQSRLAAELGIGKSRISELLAGKRKPDLVL